MDQYFDASWSPQVTLFSAIVCAALVGMTMAFGGWARMIAVIVLGVSATMTVQGYELDDDRLRIRFFLFPLSYDLSHLNDAAVNPQILRNTTRFLGVGGLFGFSGIFWSSTLGMHRVFGTHEDHAVILNFGGKTIIVTPDRPDAFVDALQKRRAG